MAIWLILAIFFWPVVGSQVDRVVVDVHVAHPLQAVFDASRDGILIEDGANIAYINKFYTHFLGYETPDGFAICQHFRMPGFWFLARERFEEFQKDRR